jgi:hypothetical protein
MSDRVWLLSVENDSNIDLKDARESKFIRILFAWEVFE